MDGGIEAVGDGVVVRVVGLGVVGAGVLGRLVGFCELVAVVVAGDDVGELVVVVDDEVVPVVRLGLGFSGADPQAAASNNNPTASVVTLA